MLLLCPRLPSLWHCRRNQHRLLPLLHASLAVVGNPYHWFSYYLCLHRLMMSQFIHKFVVVCCFKKFDMAAGCTGMKEPGRQTAKT